VHRSATSSSHVDYGASQQPFTVTPSGVNTTGSTLEYFTETILYNTILQALSDTYCQSTCLSVCLSVCDYDVVDAVT